MKRNIWKTASLLTSKSCAGVRIAESIGICDGEGDGVEVVVTPPPTFPGVSVEGTSSVPDNNIASKTPTAMTATIAIVAKTGVLLFFFAGGLGGGAYCCWGWGAYCCCGGGA